MEFAERLKAARVALGLSIPEIVSHSGVPVGSYQKYEGGQRKSPNNENLRKLVSIGISEQWLVSGVEPILSKDRAPQGAIKTYGLVSEPTPEMGLSLIHQALIENCLRACQEVHGEQFKAMTALDQLAYAVDLYNLILRMTRDVGNNPISALRLEVTGLSEQLRLFLRMEWAKRFPPPLGKHPIQMF